MSSSAISSEFVKASAWVQTPSQALPVLVAGACPLPLSFMNPRDVRWKCADLIAQLNITTDPTERRKLHTKLAALQTTYNNTKEF